MRRAKINFDNAVTSLEYGDIYFSKDDAIAESTYVFLDNNQLPIRFKKNKKIFSVAELGFGSGLNFLLTADLWHKEEWLYYYAIEGYPMSTPDLVKTLSPFSDNLNIKILNELLSAWDNLKLGANIITFPDFKIKIMLIINDISKFFTHIPNNSIQAWYLDGFAPSKNLAMWEDYIYLNMRDKSSAEATFSTFTAAAKVKRGLINAGFIVEKIKGYGRKREMLRGRIAY